MLLRALSQPRIPWLGGTWPKFEGAFLPRDADRGTRRGIRRQLNNRSDVASTRFSIDPGKAPGRVFMAR